MNAHKPSQVSDRVTVDCIAHYREDLGAEVAGVQDYGDRSMLIPSLAAVVHAHHGVSYIHSYHHYLKDLGLGAREIVPVNGANTLFASIQQNPEARTKIKRLVNEQGCRIDAFCSYDPFAQFVAEMQLDEQQVRSTLDLGLVKHLDNKRRLRELDAQLPGRKRFLEYVTAETPEGVLAAFDLMFEKCDAVYLKADDLESGVGTQRFQVGYTEADVNRHLEKYHTDDRTWIVEQAIINKFEGSVQWYITPEDEVLQKRFMSRQYIENDVHQGNAIPHHHYDAFPFHWSETERRRLAEHVWDLTEPFARWAKRQGYVGYLGFDFILDRETRNVYLLEANARKTGATYPESARWQIEATGRLNEACVAMHNCHPNAELNDYRKVVDRLQSHGLAMDAETGTGVLVANPRCLLGADPKCILISIQETLKQAEDVLRAAIDCVQ